MATFILRPEGVMGLQTVTGVPIEYDREWGEILAQHFGEYVHNEVYVTSQRYLPERRGWRGNFNDTVADTLHNRREGDGPIIVKVWNLGYGANGLPNGNIDYGGEIFHDPLAPPAPPRRNPPRERVENRRYHPAATPRHEAAEVLASQGLNPDRRLVALFKRRAERMSDAAILASFQDYRVLNGGGSETRHDKYLQYCPGSIYAMNNALLRN